METKRKCIEPGMLIYDTPPQILPDRTDEEGRYVLSKAKMQRLKEVIAPHLQADRANGADYRSVMNSMKDVISRKYRKEINKKKK